MVVDGVELLKMVKENKFENDDEIRAEIITNEIYVYSAYYKNFFNKKTGKKLSVTDYIFWTFEILSEEEEEIDIQAIEELDEWVVRRNGEVTQTEGKILEIGNKLNELIKAVKQLNRKIKGE